MACKSIIERDLDVVSTPAGGRLRTSIVACSVRASLAVTSSASVLSQVNLFTSGCLGSFGLMHMFATNVCILLRAVVKETVRDVAWRLRHERGLLWRASGGNDSAAWNLSAQVTCILVGQVTWILLAQVAWILFVQVV